jgi:hypothetical protein
LKIPNIHDDLSGLAAVLAGLPWQAGRETMEKHPAGKRILFGTIIAVAYYMLNAML